jgi:hypothetical protein
MKKINNVENFSIVESDIYKLDRRVKCEIYFTWPAYKKYAHFSSEKRKEMFAQHGEIVLKKMVKKYQISDYTKIGWDEQNTVIIGLILVISGRVLKKIVHDPLVSRIDVTSIQGYKRKSGSLRVKKKLSNYVIRVYRELWVEGSESTDHYEEGLFLIKNVFSEKLAVDKVRKFLTQKPSLNYEFKFIEYKIRKIEVVSNSFVTTCCDGDEPVELAYEIRDSFFEKGI